MKNKKVGRPRLGKEKRVFIGAKVDTKTKEKLDKKAKELKSLGKAIDFFVEK